MAPPKGRWSGAAFSFVACGANAAVDGERVSAGGSVESFGKVKVVLNVAKGSGRWQRPRQREDELPDFCLTIGTRVQP